MTTTKDTTAARPSATPARPRVFTYAHSDGRKPIVPNPSHQLLSIGDLCDAVITLSVAQHAMHMRACLASQTEQGELQAWADDADDELSIEIDRLLIELENRTDLTALEVETRDYAIMRGWHCSRVLGQLGLRVTVERVAADLNARTAA